MEISFTPLQELHFPLLLKWLNSDHVQEFWDKKIWTFSSIKEKYETYAIKAFIILAQDTPIGYIHYYDAFDFDRKNFAIDNLQKVSSLAALDFFIAELNFLEKNLGSEILKQFLKEHIFNQFDSCLVDLSKNNKSAIRAYAKAGFSTHSDTDSSITLIAHKHTSANPIIILGSSRSNGCTAEAIDLVQEEASIPLIDLNHIKMSYYDYDYKNRDDDFLASAEQMVKHNPIILATPVYWYSMSAIMKTFLDRWTDIIDIRKDIGRRLAGKELFLIASYAGEQPKNFEDPFSQTCSYLDMEYKGCFYFYSGSNEERKKQNAIFCKDFVSKVWRKDPFSQIKS